MTLTDVSLAEARRVQRSPVWQRRKARSKPRVSAIKRRLAIIRRRGAAKIAFAAKSEDARVRLRGRHHPVIKKAGMRLKSRIQVKIAEAAFCRRSAALSLSTRIVGLAKAYRGRYQVQRHDLSGRRTLGFVSEGFGGQRILGAAQLQAVVEVSEALGNAWSNVSVQQASIQAGWFAGDGGAKGV